MDSGHLLKSMLPMAVMLNTLNFKKLPWEQLQRIATDASQFIAEHGDNILFKGPRKGDTAKAFNELAKGVTVLSFAPGGVNILGMHFEAVHPESVEAGRWIYHSTFTDSVPDVAKNGLVPGDGSRWERKDVKEWSKGKVFFTLRQQMVEDYAKTVFTENLEKRGWSWNPVLLRTWSGHMADLVEDSQSMDGWYVERNVPAILLQVWVPQKEMWTEIREAAARGYFENGRTVYGEPGPLEVAPDANPWHYAKKYIEQFWPQ